MQANFTGLYVLDLLTMTSSNPYITRKRKKTFQLKSRNSFNLILGFFSFVTKTHHAKANGPVPEVFRGTV